MPVAAVTFGGRPTVSAGSAMTRRGSMRGWKMIFLPSVASLVTTAARPTSLPVPAVVGHRDHRGDAVGIGAASTSRRYPRSPTAAGSGRP